MSGSNPFDDVVQSPNSNVNHYGSKSRIPLKSSEEKRLICKVLAEAHNFTSNSKQDKLEEVTQTSVYRLLKLLPETEQLFEENTLLVNAQERSSLLLLLHLMVRTVLSDQPEIIETTKEVFNTIKDFCLRNSIHCWEFSILDLPTGEINLGI